MSDIIKFEQEAVYVSESGYIEGKIKGYDNYIEFKEDEASKKSIIILNGLIKDAGLEKDMIFIKTIGQEFAFKGENLELIYDDIYKRTNDFSNKNSSSTKVLDAVNHDKWSIYSIIGFIVSIIGGLIPIYYSPVISISVILIAVITSIYGTVEICKYKYRGLGFAILGIIISVVSCLGVIATA